MKNIYLVLAISLFLTQHSYAQGEIGGYNVVKDGFISVSPTDINDNVKGSQYITDDFVPAKISISKNEVFQIKFNGVLDEIVVKGQDGKPYALNKHLKDIKITLIGSKKAYQMFDYVNENDTRLSGYFLLNATSNSNIKLLKKEKIKFFEEKVATNGYDSNVPAQYKRLKDKFFIKKNDELAIEIPTNKKDFAKLFPKRQKEILSFIKKEKIKFKKESDLLKLVNHLN